MGRRTPGQSRPLSVHSRRIPGFRQSRRRGTLNESHPTKHDKNFFLPKNHCERLLYSRQPLATFFDRPPLYILKVAGADFLHLLAQEFCFKVISNQWMCCCVALPCMHGDNLPDFLGLPFLCEASHKRGCQFFHPPFQRAVLVSIGPRGRLAPPYGDRCDNRRMVVFMMFLPNKSHS